MLQETSRRKHYHYVDVDTIQLLTAVAILCVIKIVKRRRLGEIEIEIPSHFFHLLNYVSIISDDDDVLECTQILDCSNISTYLYQNWTIYINNYLEESRYVIVFISSFFYIFLSLSLYLFTFTLNRATPKL